MDPVSRLILFITFIITGVTAEEPAVFQPKVVGRGGDQFKDSPHFRIYGVSDAKADATIKQLEAAYSCFVQGLGWRSSGLSYNPGSDNGPYYKTNIYGLARLDGGAAGVMRSDAKSGMSYLDVLATQITVPSVTVHEYGHGLTYHERNWVDQTRTGAWWETVAQFVADTYMTSSLCEKARAKYQIPEGRTIMELGKTIGNAHWVILDGTQRTANHYDAWPFLVYLTNNPDNYPGLGPSTVRDMFRKYARGSNETPLHTLQRVAAGTKVQKIVGRYWARMAYVDIGHKQARQRFQTARSTINYKNLDAAGTGSYNVKADRRPKYFGSNIIPLRGTGPISVQVTAATPFTATLVIKTKNGDVKYLELEAGSGKANLEAGEEASLVVVNTPDALILYDPFQITATSPVAQGLNYAVKITGATV